MSARYKFTVKLKTCRISAEYERNPSKSNQSIHQNVSNCTVFQTIPWGVCPKPPSRADGSTMHADLHIEKQILPPPSKPPPLPSPPPFANLGNLSPTPPPLNFCRVWRA